MQNESKSFQLQDKLISETHLLLELSTRERPFLQDLSYLVFSDICRLNLKSQLRKWQKVVSMHRFCPIRISKLGYRPTISNIFFIATVIAYLNC